MPKHFKQNRIMPSIVFLVSVFISLFSFIWNNQIVDLESNQHVEWIVIISVCAVINILVSFLFLIFGRLNWNKNLFSKIFFTTLNICTISTILFLALPVVFNNTKLHWMILIIISIKVVEILCTLFLKDLKNATSLKWTFIGTVTVIPIFIGIILGFEKLWAIPLVILLWEGASALVEMNYNDDFYIYEGTILNRNPFYQNGMQFFILIFFWFIVWNFTIGNINKTKGKW